MSVARVTEIKSSSTKSFEDAIQNGLERTARTIQNLKSAWIAEQEVILDDDAKVCEYRVLMKVTFLVND